MRTSLISHSIVIVFSNYVCPRNGLIHSRDICLNQCDRWFRRQITFRCNIRYNRSPRYIFFNRRKHFSVVSIEWIMLRLSKIIVVTVKGYLGCRREAISIVIGHSGGGQVPSPVPIIKLLRNFVEPYWLDDGVWQKLWERFAQICFLMFWFSLNVFSVT